MSLAAILVMVTGGVWVGYGSFWLLRHRSYRVDQIPRFVMDLIGFPVEYIQTVRGRSGVPWALLMPNLVIFGLFTFVPVILNFWVSLTGGPSINIYERPFIGVENYTRIFDCETILTPKTCTNEGYAFWRGLFNTLFYVAVQVPVLCLASLMTALVVNKSLAGRGFWRAMYFYPVMLSPVVIANIWSWMLDRKGALNAALGSTTETISALSATAYFDLTMTVILGVLLLVASERTLRAGREPSVAWATVFGVLFTALMAWSNIVAAIVPGAPGWASLLAGLVLSGWLAWFVSTGSAGIRYALIAFCIAAAALLLTIQFDTVFDLGRFRPINWLVTPNTGWPMFWLIFVYTWSNMGFYMLILLAGLQAIPPDLYEAAKMDATKPFRVFSRITMPLLVPTMLVVLVLVLIRSFQMFDEAYLLTGGGPGSETRMIVQNIYDTAFGTPNPDYGIASAASILMALIIAVFTFAQLYMSRRSSGV
ncbi:carbohydrate ABC transporter permease [Halovulum sp. GXIMD14794]